MLTGLWTDAEAREVGPSASPTLGESTTWESATPFVPTRHPKTVRGVEVDGIVDQIKAACRQLIGVEPIEVSRVAVPRHHESWARYQRRRRGGGRRGPDHAYGARLVFAEAVRGPLALGFGAHFGLGTFIPVG